MSRSLNNGLSLMHKMMGVRRFSSSSYNTGPFLRLGSMVKEDKDGLDDVLLFDAAKEELFTVPDKPHPHELADTTVVASSLGWGFFSGFSDRSLYISDHLNPLSSTSKVIPLPPLTALSTCQTDVFCNVAMSCDDDDDDQDLVVAVKFLGRQLSLCRPNRDLRWTNIATPFPFLERSNLMFSNRDRKFYLPLPGSTYLYSWDLLHFTPSFRKFMYTNRPKLSQSEHQLLDSCSRADHWVESPSGERFLVKCYTHHTLERDPLFMVFREKEETEDTFDMCYTEDIGDLCIFISDSDPFCLHATSCPGLVPNSIYLTDSAFGVYHLPTKSLRHFDGKPFLGKGEVQPTLPHWLPPSTSLLLSGGA
ncbi:hypothetical protein HA466_0293370 [Hirschfeldia incana]|nr:hypothetical protein HA466_0318710 [Hirschfeldia incana]KAJ0232132.1 hypothetical protein HA466_0293370 [Hirschfeldia incana]